MIELLKKRVLTCSFPKKLLEYDVKNCANIAPVSKAQVQSSRFWLLVEVQNELYGYVKSNYL